MIKNFRHKGLERFFLTGSTAGIQAKHAERLKIILSRLDDAVNPEDADFSGSGLHPLKGDLKGFWSLKVSANWRIIFRMSGGSACDVELIDYH